MRRFSLWLLSLLLFAATPAFADKCTDTILDESSSLSSVDRSNIDRQISTLRSLGAEVHVQLLSSYHRNSDGQMMKSLTEYKQFMQGKCSSWRAPDNGFKNNIILVLVVPKKFTEGSKKGAPFGLFYGSQWTPKLGERFNGILDGMEGNFRDQKWGAGIVAGLTDVSDLIGVKQSQVGKPIVINHSADYSGVWGSAITWFFMLILLGGGIALVMFVLRKKGANDTAQRAAQTERGKCSVYENGFEMDFAGLKARIATNATVSGEWKVRLSDLLDQAQGTQATASGQLSGLNRSSNNPDTPRLSEEAYTDMTKRYAGVVRVYQEADRLMKLAASEFEKAKRGEPLPAAHQEQQPKTGAAPVAFQEVRRNPSTSAPEQNRGRTSPSTPASAVQPRVIHHHHHDDPTIVVQQPSNDGFLTGVILGEMIGDQHRHNDEYERSITRDRASRRDDNGPVIYNPPEPTTREGGGERIASPSGEGGGGERIASLSGDGAGGERGSDERPAPAEDQWSEGNKTSY